MAYITLDTGKSTALTHEQGLILWEVLQGRVEPTEQQRRWAVHVKRLYLDPYTAPDDYVTKYLLEIGRAVLHDYMVDRDGNVTIPDWARPQARAFARKYPAAMQRAKRLYPHG